MVTDRATGAPALVIVVEPQGREDKTKAYSWPTYLAIAQEAVQCPSAVLLVVCPGPREADKCRQVIKMGHPGLGPVPDYPNAFPTWSGHMWVTPGRAEERLSSVTGLPAPFGPRMVPGLTVKVRSSTAHAGDR